MVLGSWCSPAVTTAIATLFRALSIGGHFAAKKAFGLRKPPADENSLCEFLDGIATRAARCC
jgi:hypothetical protein